MTADHSIFSASYSRGRRDKGGGCASVPSSFSSSSLNASSLSVAQLPRFEDAPLDDEELPSRQDKVFEASPTEDEDVKSNEPSRPAAANAANGQEDAEDATGSYTYSNSTNSPGVRREIFGGIGLGMNLTGGFGARPYHRKLQKKCPSTTAVLTTTPTSPSKSQDSPSGRTGNGHQPTISNSYKNSDDESSSSDCSSPPPAPAERVREREQIRKSARRHLLDDLLDEEDYGVGATTSPNLVPAAPLKTKRTPPASPQQTPDWRPSSPPTADVITGGSAEEAHSDGVSSPGPLSRAFTFSVLVEDQQRVPDPKAASAACSSALREQVNEQDDGPAPVLTTTPAVAAPFPTDGPTAAPFPTDGPAAAPIAAVVLEVDPSNRQGSRSCSSSSSPRPLEAAPHLPDPLSLSSTRPPRLPAPPSLLAPPPTTTATSRRSSTDHEVQTERTTRTQHTHTSTSADPRTPRSRTTTGKSPRSPRGARTHQQPVPLTVDGECQKICHVLAHHVSREDGGSAADVWSEAMIRLGIESCHDHCQERIKTLVKLGYLIPNSEFGTGGRHGGLGGGRGHRSSPSSSRRGCVGCRRPEETYAFNPNKIVNWKHLSWEAELKALKQHFAARMQPGKAGTSGEPLMRNAAGTGTPGAGGATGVESDHGRATALVDAHHKLRSETEGGSRSGSGRPSEAELLPGTRRPCAAVAMGELQHDRHDLLYDDLDIGKNRELEDASLFPVSRSSYHCSSASDSEDHDEVMLLNSPFALRAHGSRVACFRSRFNPIYRTWGGNSSIPVGGCCLLTLLAVLTWYITILVIAIVVFFTGLFAGSVPILTLADADEDGCQFLLEELEEDVEVEEQEEIDLKMLDAGVLGEEQLYAGGGPPRRSHNKMLRGPPSSSSSVRSGFGGDEELQEVSADSSASERGFAVCTQRGSRASKRGSGGVRYYRGMLDEEPTRRSGSRESKVNSGVVGAVVSRGGNKNMFSTSSCPYRRLSGHQLSAEESHKRSGAQYRHDTFSSTAGTAKGNNSLTRSKVGLNALPDLEAGEAIGAAAPTTVASPTATPLQAMGVVEYGRVYQMKIMTNRETMFRQDKLLVIFTSPTHKSGRVRFGHDIHVLSTPVQGLCRWCCASGPRRILVLQDEEQLKSERLEPTSLTPQLAVAARCSYQSNDCALVPDDVEAGEANVCCNPQEPEGKITGSVGRLGADEEEADGLNASTRSPSPLPSPNQSSDGGLLLTSSRSPTDVGASVVLAGGPCIRINDERRSPDSNSTSDRGIIINGAAPEPDDSVGNMIEKLRLRESEVVSRAAIVEGAIARKSNPAVNSSSTTSSNMSFLSQASRNSLRLRHHEHHSFVLANAADATPPVTRPPDQLQETSPERRESRLSQEEAPPRRWSQASFATVRAALGEPELPRLIPRMVHGADAFTPWTAIKRQLHVVDTRTFLAAVNGADVVKTTFSIERVGSSCEEDPLASGGRSRSFGSLGGAGAARRATTATRPSTVTTRSSGAALGGLGVNQAAVVAGRKNANGHSSLPPGATRTSSGTLVLGPPPALELQLDAGTTGPPPPEVSLRVLAYNIWMMPQIITSVAPKSWNLSPEKSERAARIPDAIPQNLDVIVFCEAFCDGTMAQITKKLRERGFMFDTIPPIHPRRFISSGIKIYSREKIVDTDWIIYEKCSGDEVLASKGCTYAKIKKGPLHVHVFGTHLQAWDGKQAQADRRAQLRQIRSFIAKKKIPTTEPVLICGDFNIEQCEDMDVDVAPGGVLELKTGGRRGDREAPAAAVVTAVADLEAEAEGPQTTSTSSPVLFTREYQTMMKLLNAENYAASYQPSVLASNQWCSFGSVSSSPAESLLLDYILLAKHYLQPTSVKITTEYVQSLTPLSYAGQGFVDLSDHYPVLGEFRFPVLGKKGGGGGVLW